ncbi:MAG: aminodeoxychorismate synthase component I [Bacteroidales bacterium]|nr:aminodeoxychorismate synthase component I [Bacteroidales bacterium]
MNLYGTSKTPFLFIIDYEIKKAFVSELNDLNNQEILFKAGEFKNYDSRFEDNSNKKVEILKKWPVDYERYMDAFTYVIEKQKQGYSYLLNLTFPSKIDVDGTLLEIFFSSRAKYKLIFKNEFVVFSPEIFVQIKDGIISSFPMKGTIDASLPNAEETILSNAKEKAEHATIVDLIRNDLSLVADNIRVENYRYIEKIRTNQKDLLQVSSKITGTLPEGYCKSLGTIFSKILPAGSICGAPKLKTLELIKKAENYERGYYTGIFGIFDGENVDSAVMIRFIEDVNGVFFYKSGGGITTMSKPEDEYNELIHKIYVPFG